jgi:hypothetical protein
MACVDFYVVLNLAMVLCGSHAKVMLDGGGGVGDNQEKESLQEKSDKTIMLNKEDCSQVSQVKRTNSVGVLPPLLSCWMKVTAPSSPRFLHLQNQSSHSV